MYAQINGETINSQNLIYEKYSAPVYAAKRRYESGGSVISEEGYSAVYGETGIGVGLTVRAGINDGGRLRIDDYQKGILCSKAIIHLRRVIARSTVCSSIPDLMMSSRLSPFCKRLNASTSWFCPSSLPCDIP